MTVAIRPRSQSDYKQPIKKKTYYLVLSCHINSYNQFRMLPTSIKSWQIQERVLDTKLDVFITCIASYVSYVIIKQ